jgi:hypothetical protein
LGCQQFWKNSRAKDYVPISIPNLDDMTWEDLVREGRSLIPAWAPEWTNHNPSDPGITLIELFAFLSEVLIYRINRISDDHIVEFLKLMNGPGWAPVKSLSDEKINAIGKLLHPRLVTTSDYERMLIANRERLTLSTGETVARVKCVGESDLDLLDATPEPQSASGHMSVVVLSDRLPTPSKELLRRIKHFLEPRKLLTTRLHIVPPQYITVGVRATLVLKQDGDWEAIQSGAIDRLQVFFDPLEGGFDRKGWPFGRGVYVSEVYQLLQDIPGVEYVRRSVNAKTGREIVELDVPPSVQKRERLNTKGELEAVELLPHELVRIMGDRTTILVDQTRRSGKA